MNAYRTESSFFRPVFGAAAVALTALTVSLAVVLPANLQSPAPDALALANPSAHVTEVSISPAVVEVVLLREHKGVPEMTRSSLSTQQPARAARAVPAQTSLAPAAASTMVEWRCPSAVDGHNV